MDETELRLSVFFSVLLGLFLLEQMFARVKSATPRWKTQLSNLGLSVLAAILLSVLPVVSILAAAYWVTQIQWGLMSLDSMPMLVRIGMGILVLDVAVYWQHRWMHTVPLLWRLHKVHHSDLDVDVVTAVRFHPFEILVSQAWKVSIVLLLGVPVMAVVIFEIALSTCALFTHTGITLPFRVERYLRLVITTPAMHKIHHSCRQPDTDRNFTTVLSLWDRLFGSYRAPLPSQKIETGLAEYPHSLALPTLLALPFLKEKQGD